MRSFAPRFTPLDASRPRGAPLLEGFSPKLGRRVRLFDRATFDQWLRLETDPTVLCFCEHPVRLGAALGSRLVDFWVQREEGEQLLFVDDGHNELSSPTASDIPLQRVATADLAAAAIWIDNKIKEACARNGGGTVALSCDEAQRYDENEYEWLRDVHDHLDRLQIRLFTFLVGQQELLAVKTALQRAKKTQIVARLMVEELAFFGIRNVRDVATSLNGYDQTCFPRTSDWSFTRFYLPKAMTGGYRLVDDAPLLWDAFEQLHHRHALPGTLEIPMESFTRVVEIVLKDSALHDAPGYRPDPALWDVAVRSCGYIQSRRAVGSALTTMVA